MGAEEGRRDEQGYNSSSNGEMLVADANKAGDTSRCHPLMTVHTPVHSTGSMAVVLKLQPG